ncbi:SWIB domain-containing protein/Plus-3 domain-containing protein, partial [Cephalotus follicularis]
MGRKKKIRKEEIAEDVCFVCKDGGSLRICDYKDCLKAYHPNCVKKDDSLLETEELWCCGWHFCCICFKTPKFHCFCCPSAVCGRCLCNTEFAVHTGKRGFCGHCLELGMILEGNKDVDITGEKIDFTDQETYEYTFKEYWEITKEKEGLTSEHVHSAYNLLKKGKNCNRISDSSENGGEEDDGNFEDESQHSESDYEAEALDETEEFKPVGKRKNSKGKLTVREKKVKSKQQEFVGWGSKCLKEFLASIGKETAENLSQHDVSSIITEYCLENNLFHPKKKKKVICDARLQSLFRRKSIYKNSIHNLLTIHFAENLEQSENDLGLSSEDMDEAISVAGKRMQNSNLKRTSQRQEEVPCVGKSSFASIVSENIKRIYLKRSLVQELLKQVEAFESKIIGSFVRVKSDPNDYLQKNSHQLVQVTGILKNGKTNSEVVLQVSNIIKDVPISKLSDDDFSEYCLQDECEDLRQRVKDGILKRPTIMEFEQKARSLHENITTHWIKRELVLLQSHIDRANEKGWRRELQEYMNSLLLLQTPSEQSRLLHEVPDIIADSEELELSHGDSSKRDEKECNATAESAFTESFKTPVNNLKGNGIYSSLNTGTVTAAGLLIIYVNNYISRSFLWV